MKIKRNRDRPGKKRGIKSWFSVGMIVLVGIITLGIIAALISPAAALGSSGGGGGSSSSTGTVSKPNIENAPIVSHRLFNEVYFDESYTVSSDSTNKTMSNVKIDEKMKYGTLDTSKGYLEYSFSAEDGEITSDSEFGIYLSGLSTPENEVSIGMSAMDYLVIDFDVWSNGDYFPMMYFSFDTENVDWWDDNKLCIWQCPLEKYGTVLTRSHYLTMYDMWESKEEFKIFEDEYVSLENQSEKLHITILVKIFQDDYEQVRDYLDGDHFTYYVNNFMRIEDCVNFKIGFAESTLNEDYSVCFDNFQFCAYGVGDGSYDGDISRMLNNVENGVVDNDCLDIKNCRDWVLYGKYE